MDAVLTMIDRETGTIWTHLDGTAIGGPLQGQRINMILLIHTTWDKWKASNPETLVLSPETPFKDTYRPVTIGLFNRQEALFGDDRLEPNELVIGVEVGGQFKGYPLPELQQIGGVLNDVLAGRPILVIYDPSGQTGVAFYRELGELALEFSYEDTERSLLRDHATGSLWNSSGQAVSGPLIGTSLAFAPSFISEWYGWSGYHPETDLFEGI